jgi:hypothetical protein
MASKTIARRKTTEEEVAPQSQILYGTPLHLHFLRTRADE